MSGARYVISANACRPSEAVLTEYPHLFNISERVPRRTALSSATEGKMRFQLHPLDRKFPLVVTADIGKVGAETLTQG
jgi:hypothetical protein